MDNETLRLWLMVGQYIAIPIAVWVGRTVMRSIDAKIQQSGADVMAYVDTRISTHETGQMDKLDSLGERIGRIEGALINRALNSPEPQ